MNKRLQRIALDAANRNGMRAVMMGKQLYIALPFITQSGGSGHQLVPIKTLKQLYIEMGY